MAPVDATKQHLVQPAWLLPPVSQTNQKFGCPFCNSKNLDSPRTLSYKACSVTHSQEPKWTNPTSFSEIKPTTKPEDFCFERIFRNNFGEKKVRNFDLRLNQSLVKSQRRSNSDILTKFLCDEEIKAAGEKKTEFENNETMKWPFGRKKNRQFWEAKKVSKLVVIDLFRGQLKKLGPLELFFESEPQFVVPKAELKHRHNAAADTENLCDHFRRSSPSS